MCDHAYAAIRNYREEEAKVEALLEGGPWFLRKDLQDSIERRLVFCVDAKFLSGFNVRLSADALAVAQTV